MKLRTKLFIFIATLLAVVCLAPRSAHASAMRTPINYLKSSETIPYPDINKLKDPWIKVSIAKNRVYIMDGQKVVYTMYCSAGKYENKNGKRVSMTPTGTFAQQFIKSEDLDSAVEKVRGIEGENDFCFVFSSRHN